MKVVECLSGGIDSSTLLYWLISKGYKPYALVVNYGQNASREITSALQIADTVNVPARIVQLQTLKSLLKSSLTSSGLVKSTVVPNRNMILLSVAAGMAASNDIHNVAYAAHHNDYSMYPDCRSVFVDALEDTLRKSLDDESFTVVAPFLPLYKRDIVKIGLNLGVPYELTWSCYAGGEVHCGICPSCKERHLGFVENNAVDPTVYEVQPVI